MQFKQIKILTISPKKYVNKEVRTLTLAVSEQFILFSIVENLIVKVK